MTIQCPYPLPYINLELGKSYYNGGLSKREIISKVFVS